MKKLLFFALMLSLCFTFIACGDDDPTPPPLTHEAVLFTDGVSDYTIYYEKDNAAAEEFATKLLEEEKLAIVPGTAFGDCGEGFLRISYAYSIEQLKEALNRMESFVKRHRK